MKLCAISKGFTTPRGVPYSASALAVVRWVIERARAEFGGDAVWDE